MPPLTSSSPKLPDTPDEIQKELCKQESLLNQIHSEMNAGFVSKKREEQLWEVQRIITQLKRKLKSFEKKQDKSMEELDVSTTTLGNDTTDSVIKTKTSSAEDETMIPNTVLKEIDNKTANEKTQSNDNKSKEDASAISPSFAPNFQKSDDRLYVDEESGFITVRKTHPDYATLLRLQLENQELLGWKMKLQTRISAERAEILRLKQLLQQNSNNKLVPNKMQTELAAHPEGDYERVIEHFIKENALLEHKKQMLAKEIFEENKQCIAYQVELAMQKF